MIMTRLPYAGISLLQSDSPQSHDLRSEPFSQETYIRLQWFVSLTQERYNTQVRFGMLFFFLRGKALQSYVPLHAQGPTPTLRSQYRRWPVPVSLL